jgi:hypothetical protein
LDALSRGADDGEVISLSVDLEKIYARDSGGGHEGIQAYRGNRDCLLKQQSVSADPRAPGFLIHWEQGAGCIISIDVELGASIFFSNRHRQNDEIRCSPEHRSGRAQIGLEGIHQEARVATGKVQC